MHNQRFGRFIGNIKLNIYRTTSWLLEGALNTIRGTAQIVTTPFTLLIRIPLRALITSIKGFPTIENNKGVKRQVKKAKSLMKKIKDKEIKSRKPISHLENTLTDLQRRYEKGRRRGQRTDISSRTNSEEYCAYSLKSKNFWEDTETTNKTMEAFDKVQGTQNPPTFSGSEYNQSVSASVDSFIQLFEQQEKTRLLH